MQCLVTRVYYLQEWSSVWGDGLLPWGPVHVPCDPHHQRPPGPRAGLAFAEPARPEPRLLVPRPPAEKKAGLRRQKRLSSTLLSLSRSVQELTEENQSLKEDLDRVLSSSPTVSRTKGTFPEHPGGPRGGARPWFFERHGPPSPLQGPQVQTRAPGPHLAQCGRSLTSTCCVPSAVLVLETVVDRRPGCPSQR